MRQRRETGDAAPDPPGGGAWPVVLGVDPGTRVLGYGSLVLAPDGPRLLAAGTIRPAARAAIAERLHAIRAGLEAELARCRPAVVVVERAYSARNVQSALRLGEARGVVLACAAAAGAAVAELSASEAKKAVLGHGGGSKEQVASMVALRLGIEVPGRLDVSDALALALAHAKRMEWAATVRRSDAAR